MLSIITPVYNGERYIEACITNILEQNCIDLEHIIIDGKSTDRTVEIIQKYALNYDHIRYISEMDDGQADAMNKGINLANGDTIGFLNADDSYKPGVLNLIVKLFKKFPELTFITGNCDVWDANSQLLLINIPKSLKLSDILLGWRLNPYPICSSAYFYHKSLHDIIGLYKNIDIGTDLDFLLRVVQKANLRYINKTLGNFNLVYSSKTFLSSKKSILYTNTYTNDLFKVYKKDLSVIQKLIFPFKKIFLTFLYLIRKRKEVKILLSKIVIKKETIFKILSEIS